MKRLAFLAVVACLCGCVLTGTGRAEQLINVDFNEIGGSSGTYSGAAVLGAAGDTWNGVGGNFRDTTARTNLPLVAASGASSGVTLSFSGQAGFFDTGRFGVFHATPYAALMNDYVYVQGPAITASFSGLTPGGSYELILYSASDDKGRAAIFTVNGSSQTVVDPSGSTTFGLDLNYADFTAMADGSGQLSFTVAPGPPSPHGFIEGDLNGIQLQSLTVPEPASLTLLGIGAVGLLGYCWRKRKRAAREVGVSSRNR